VKGINIGELRKLQIPLPPRQVQNEIATKLEGLTSVQDAMTNHVERQRALRTAALETLIGGSTH
jgi:restriction endonuclease S subunit